MIDDVAYLASWMKRKKERPGGSGGGGEIESKRDRQKWKREIKRQRKRCGGGPWLSGFLGALGGPTRGFKGVLNLNVAEARKARQLGVAAGCQNLCPFPPLLPNRTTTYAQTSSSFSSSSSSTGCAYSSGLFSSSRCEFRQDDRVFENPNYPQ